MPQETRAGTAAADAGRNHHLAVPCRADRGVNMCLLAVRRRQCARCEAAAGAGLVDMAGEYGRQSSPLCSTAPGRVAIH